MNHGKEAALRLIGKNVFSELTYFECDDGWFDILANLTKEIEAEIAKEPNLASLKVVQVKEKFGGLRYYVSVENSAISAAIERAEKESANTCETCGAPGQNRSIHRWMRTECDEHYAKRVKACAK